MQQSIFLSYISNSTSNFCVEAYVMFFFTTRIKIKYFFFLQVKALFELFFFCEIKHVSCSFLLSHHVFKKFKMLTQFRHSTYNTFGLLFTSNPVLPLQDQSHTEHLSVSPYHTPYPLPAPAPSHPSYSSQQVSVNALHCSLPHLIPPPSPRLKPSIILQPAGER